MRQIFTSPRLENVEGVARMLNEHGIETRVSQPRSYKGNRRSGYSYTAHARGQGGQQPAVWVVRSDDQTRARQLMREAGLMESTRPTYVPVLEEPTPVRRSPAQAALRIRLVLLGIAAAGAAVMAFRLFG